MRVHVCIENGYSKGSIRFRKVGMELLFDLNQVSTQNCAHEKENDKKKKQNEQEKREWSAENTFYTFKSTQPNKLPFT